MFQPANPDSKPTTRSSVRHSFNLSSMSKALADVIKDSGPSKSKDASSRRSSSVAVLAPSNGVRSSGDKTALRKLPPVKQASPPDSKTITRRTRASAAADVADDSASTSDGSKLSRVASLRPRPAAATNSSSLPKYRPKSVIIEASKKSATPVRAGTRRKHSEDENQSKAEDTATEESPRSRAARPISPLPRRAVRKTVAGSPAPLSTSSNVFRASPRSVRPSEQPSALINSPPTLAPGRRPSTPTPNRPSSKKALPKHHSPAQTADGRTPSPTRIGKAPSRPTIAYPQKKTSSTDSGSSRTLVNSLTDSPHTSFTEGLSTDSVDEADIEHLLGQAVPPTAPTPALPRLKVSKHRRTGVPKTPSRTSGLRPPSTSNFFLSPGDASSTQSTPSRRTLSSIKSSPENRTSILSWEQFARASHSVTEEEGEAEGLLQVPAPFRSGLASPTLSELQLDIRNMPDSPASSGFPSPVGYTSISQVLLPDVTPSPAVHSRRSFEVDPDVPVDSGTVTMLRLQLAAAEKLARDRLAHIGSLEDELIRSKESTAFHTQELQNGVSTLEEQLNASLTSHSLAQQEHNSLVGSLQTRLERAESFQKQVVREAVEEALVARKEIEHALLAAQKAKAHSVAAAHHATALWSTVHEVTQAELSSVGSSRQFLATLLADLDERQRLLRRSTIVS